MLAVLVEMGAHLVATSDADDARSTATPGPQRRLQGPAAPLLGHLVTELVHALVGRPPEGRPVAEVHAGNVTWLVWVRR